MLDGVIELKEESGHRVPFLTKKLLVTDGFWQRKKISFLPWSFTEHVKFTSGQATYPGVVGQHKMNFTGIVHFLLHFALY